MKRIFTVTIETADTPVAGSEQLDSGYSVRISDGEDWNAATRTNIGEAFEAALLDLLFDTPDAGVVG